MFDRERRKQPVTVESFNLFVTVILVVAVGSFATGYLFGVYF